MPGLIFCASSERLFCGYHLRVAQTTRNHLAHQFAPHEFARRDAPAFSYRRAKARRPRKACHLHFVVHEAASGFYWAEGCQPWRKSTSPIRGELDKITVSPLSSGGLAIFDSKYLSKSNHLSGSAEASPCFSAISRASRTRSCLSSSLWMVRKARTSSISLRSSMPIPGRSPGVRPSKK